MIMSLVSVVLKPFKKLLKMIMFPLKKLYKMLMTPMGAAFGISMFVIVMLIIVAYRRSSENFAIFQQEATLNPINNKQKKF